MSGATDDERARATLDHVRNFLVEERLGSTSISLEHLTSRLRELESWLAKAFRAARGATTWTEAIADRNDAPVPTPMLIWCPECSERHVDEVGVLFLPGFKNDETPTSEAIRSAIKEMLVQALDLTDGLIDLIVKTASSGNANERG